MQVKSLDHIHIYARDPEASAKFYERHFEAKEVVRNENRNGDLRIFLALGGQIVVVGSFPEGMTSALPPDAGDGAFGNGFGVAHLGLRVDDVTAAVEELSGRSVRILADPVIEDSGLCYAYLEAPDGVVIELTQYD